MLLSTGCITRVTHAGLRRALGLRSSTSGQELPRPSELRMLSRPCPYCRDVYTYGHLFPHPVDSDGSRVARVFRDHVPGLQALKLDDEEAIS